MPYTGNLSLYKLLQVYAVFTDCVKYKITIKDKTDVKLI